MCLAGTVTLAGHSSGLKAGLKQQLEACAVSTYFTQHMRCVFVNVCLAGTVTLAGHSSGLKAGLKQQLEAMQMQHGEQQQQLDAMQMQHGGAVVPAAHMRHRASSSG